ncbi:MAG: hypothetical protein KF773_03585 [Deltaproteobacteria bacterium]|nr:hypothetical protein [Deltaproteobacteria bacterium]MCW5801655.1 hypothetical protein [Deltaproteobacteria bacterium]
MKTLALVLAAAALAAGCDVFDDDDDDDDDDDFDGDVVVGTNRWGAALAGVEGFETVTADVVVEQTFDENVFVATITLRGDAPGEVRPWHVHAGTCEGGGEIIGHLESYPAITVSRAGTASTVAHVGVPLDPGAEYHADVHLAPDQLPVLVGCGDLIIR